MSHPTKEAVAQQDLDSEINQENDCVGAGTQCSSALGIQISLIEDIQAELTSDAKFVFDQINRCRDGALCSNSGVESLSLSALGESIVRADTLEKVVQSNRCEGDDTECTNLGVDNISPISSRPSDSRS